MLYSPFIVSILEVLLLTLPVLLTVAFVTIAERKTMASMQRRLGPNIVGYYGLLQAFADALKLLLKEYVSPQQANLILFFMGPIITLIFSLLGYAVIPFGPGMSMSDFNLGILYMLAVSSLSTYGILLAGWSANSKYAFLGSTWPMKYYKISMQQTISGELMYNLLGTLYVSCSLCAYKVKILLNMSNPQVTKAFNSLVGTSEAIRLLSIDTKLRDIAVVDLHDHQLGYKNTKNILKKKYWNQWLAGLIDGDGYFHLTKKGYASLEIIMDIRDEHALQIVKNVYGGSIKSVSNANALRYCLRHKTGFLALINDVNGHIRNSNRLVQLNKICIKYQLGLIYPEKLTYDNAWFSGFFDADGSVSINTNNGQLSINVTQKTAEMLHPLLEFYGGSVCINSSAPSFKWYLTKKKDIFKMIQYFNKHPVRSAKKNRLYLIPKWYELKDLSAHKASIGTSLEKSLQCFLAKWLKYKD